MRQQQLESVTGSAALADVSPSERAGLMTCLKSKMMLDHKEAEGRKAHGQLGLFSLLKLNCLSFCSIQRNKIWVVNFVILFIWKWNKLFILKTQQFVLPVMTNKLTRRKALWSKLSLVSSLNYCRCPKRLDDYFSLCAACSLTWDQHIADKVNVA